MLKTASEKRGMVHYHIDFYNDFKAGVNKDELLKALSPSDWFEVLNRGEQPVKTTELGYQLWRNGLNELNYRAYAQTIYPLLSPTHLHLCIRIEKIETPNS